MDYDIVIATRNRPNALEMSLPLIAQQTRQPRKLIIVDASDDPDAVPRVVEAALGKAGIPTTILTSEHRNLPYQRNVGLQEVTAPVVMMPDDDSLWYANTAEETLAIYELDKEGKIGGVTGCPTVESPLSRGKENYRRNNFYMLKQRLQPLRNRFEDRFFEQPFIAFARELWNRDAAPSWVDGKRSSLVETMGGFRMSFRSDMIRTARFDELLGYKTGYAQHEDMEASLRIQKQGKLLVSAEKALVFHHVFPSKRAGGFEYGFGQIANYIYVCCKLMPHSSVGWSRLERFVWYKVQIYRLKRDPYGRSIYRGALAAWRARKTLMNAPLDRLAEAFKTVCDSHPA